MVLILLFVPSFYKWMTGGAGPKNIADLCILLLAVWVAMSFVAIHGVGNTWETVGFNTLELVGAYMIGRSYVRTPDDFQKISKTLVWLCIALLPFAIFEGLTGNNLALQLWGYVGTTFQDIDHEIRLGLDRAQGPFQHPIHFGVYGGSLVGLAYYAATYGRGMPMRIFLTFLVLMTAFFSLSSGPLAAMVAQVGMIVWAFVFRNVKGGWWYLAGLLLVIYVLIDLLSNRTPFEVIISYMALNAQTGYGRILIFEYGMQNAFDNPIFGLGFNDWIRPRWMTPSIDMFWIIYAVTNGLPAGFLNLAAFVFMFFIVLRAKITNDRIQAYRMGWAISLIGIFIAGWMVHLWKVPFVFYCFLLGAGAWFADYNSMDEQEPPVDEGDRRQIKYTRF